MVKNMPGFDDYRKKIKDNQKWRDDIDKKCNDIRLEDLRNRGIIKDYAVTDKNENFHGDCDHPNTMENGPATALYIISMIVGSIFNHRWIIWAIATFIWLKFITRHMK